MELTELIHGCLAKAPLKRLKGGYEREAAVLMLIFERGGEPHFLLTRRTEEVSTHKGQISFPGGMRQTGETLQDTALRETYEEVGIERSRIEILGRFHDYISINQNLVAPFPAYIRGNFETVPQKSEVAEVLEVPFAVFQDSGRLRIQRMLRSGVMSDVYFFQYGSHTIWGLTARIIKDFLETLH